MIENNEEQEQTDMPKWLIKLLSVVGGLTLLCGILFILLHILVGGFPEPETLKVDFLIGFGVLILLLLYFPWSKIKFGEFEFEKLIQEEKEDYSLEIQKRELKIKELEKIVTDLKNGKNVNVDFNSESSQSEKQVNKELLYKFLSEWSNYGFTISRIKNWGGQRKGFEKFKELDSSEIRLLADELVIEDKLKIRVSRNKNILYQKK